MITNNNATTTIKGQVPPYAQPQITQFSVQESIIRTVEATVNSFGLKSLPGSDGEFKVHEDVTELAKGYKIGDSIKFTATMKASYDPEYLSETTIISINANNDDVKATTTTENYSTIVETTAETVEENPTLVETALGIVAEVESSSSTS